MLPRQDHLDQINRYHDTLVKMRKHIDVETNPDKKYLKIVDIWYKIDDIIEFTIKHTLDYIENGDIEELD